MNGSPKPTSLSARAEKPWHDDTRPWHDDFRPRPTTRLYILSRTHEAHIRPIPAYEWLSH